MLQLIQFVLIVFVGLCVRLEQLRVVILLPNFLEFDRELVHRSGASSKLLYLSEWCELGESSLLNRCLYMTSWKADLIINLKSRKHCFLYRLAKLLARSSLRSASITTARVACIAITSEQHVLVHD